jgi:hypothetical protein
VAEQTLDATDEVGYQGRISSLSSAATISASNYSGFTPRGVVLQAVAQDIWVSCDGTTATATNGVKLIVGAPQMFNVHPSKLSFLEVTASAALHYLIMKGR